MKRLLIASIALTALTATAFAEEAKKPAEPQSFVETMHLNFVGLVGGPYLGNPFNTAPADPKDEPKYPTTSLTTLQEFNLSAKPFYNVSAIKGLGLTLKFPYRSFFGSYANYEEPTNKNRNFMYNEWFKMDNMCLTASMLVYSPKIEKVLEFSLTPFARVYFPTDRGFKKSGGVTGYRVGAIPTLTFMDGKIGVDNYFYFESMYSKPEDKPSTWSGTIRYIPGISYNLTDKLSAGISLDTGFSKGKGSSGPNSYGILWSQAAIKLDHVVSDTVTLTYIINSNDVKPRTFRTLNPEIDVVYKIF